MVLVVAQYQYKLQISIHHYPYTLQIFSLFIFLSSLLLSLCQVIALEFLSPHCFTFLYAVTFIISLVRLHP